MLLRYLLLTLLALLGSSTAFAQEEQVLLYDIFLGSKPVGSREVAIRTLPPQPGVAPETRLLRVTTRIDARVAGLDYDIDSRADARATASKMSFVASTRTNGETVEIQARQDPSGTWLVTAITKGSIQQLSYRSMDVDLTGLDLFDPVRHKLLDPERGQASLLMAETGTLLSGSVAARGAGQVQVGQEAVPADQVEWRPVTGPVSLSYNLDGLLVGYEVQILGKTLTARLRSMPPPRAWGAVDVQTEFLQPDAAISEQAL